MNIPNSAASTRPVNLCPAFACDAHIHIYEPGFPTQGHSVSHAAVSDYRKVQALLGTQRAVVVQPRVYGTDNSATLYAIKALGLSDTRGVAVVSPDIDEAALQVLHDGGIRGIRFSFYKPNTGAGDFDSVERLAHKISALGWHIQLHWTADQIAQQQELLRRLPVPLVFDHLGRFPLPAATDHPAFGVVQELLQRGRAWVKLSGAYLDSVAGAPDAYCDTDVMAKAWLGIAPEQAVWGSDWPHVTEAEHKPDDAQLFDVLARWCNDDALMRRILVDNPARLYGFGP
jgi:D-galactarolactone isomerase